jgi:hypothetical protein
MLGKLGVESRTQAAVYAATHRDPHDPHDPHDPATR